MSIRPISDYYNKPDYKLPVDANSWAYMELPDIVGRSSLCGAYYQLCDGYTDAADSVRDTIYDGFTEHDKKKPVMLVSPMIRLYYQAVECIVKAICVWVGIDKYGYNGHHTKIIFQQALDKIPDNVYADENITKTLSFLHQCDEHNEGSQFGRYPLNTNNQLMGVFYGSDGKVEGYYSIGLIHFSQYMHEGLNELILFYKHLTSYGYTLSDKPVEIKDKSEDL